MFFSIFIKFKQKVIVIPIILITLFGCSPTNHLAPVDIKSSPPSKKIRHHTVSKGETLYSIAWRYDIDIRKLAKKNNLVNNKIYPGQRLSLNTSKVVITRKPKVAIRKPQTKKKSRAISKKTTPSPVRSQNKTRTVKKLAVKKNKPKSNKWVSPCRCRLSRSYGGVKGLNKGIEFKAKLGESIHAVSSGKVVFAGSGLRAYGNLVIIKHSDTLLSAYAHNQTLLVSEGDNIRAGQKIATMGQSGTDTVKLYFEVRRDGKPVNPASFIPN